MSRIHIYYFSGTGNTFFVVQKLADKLRILGNEVTMESCENCEEIKIDFDVIGIAYPIHSSLAPKVFKEFMDKMPKVEGIPLFGIVTSGYMAGDVLSFEGKSLKEKGYAPFLYRNIVVANNLNLPVLCPLKVTTEKQINKRLDRIENQISDIAKKVNSREKDIRGNKIIGKSFGVLQRTIGKVHEEVNFKGFFADDKCLICGWCIRNCPASNISLKDNKIVFKDKCILCMRCNNFCPAKAIQMTSKTKNINKYPRYKGPESLDNRTKFR